MKNIYHIVRIYENNNHHKFNEIYFESGDLPNRLYFSGNGNFYTEITKIELIKVEEGVEKKIKERVLKK